MAAPSTKSRTARANAAKRAAEKDQPKDDKSKSSEELLNEKEKAEQEAAKQKEKEAKAKEKAEAEAKARQAKVDSGDLVLTKEYEFEANTKDTKTTAQVRQIVDEIKESDQPVVFADACANAEAKYPEDILPAMLSLEHLGLVRRFDAKRLGDETQRRRSTAYLWVGDK